MLSFKGSPYRMAPEVYALYLSFQHQLPLCFSLTCNMHILLIFPLRIFQVSYYCSPLKKNSNNNNNYYYYYYCIGEKECLKP